MQGIYLHIPFCKQACHYCDFHFSTSKQGMQEMVDMLCQEISIQRDYLDRKTPVSTIYFGGGTPSILGASQLEQLLNEIHKTFKLTEKLEVTLETNPDDHKYEMAKRWIDLGVNRLSIGIQSFEEPVLHFLNRAHDQQSAIRSVKESQDCGLDNITIDLIYGIPNTSTGRWERDLRQALSLEVPHISSYCLTIEPKTVFGNLHKKGQLQPLDEETAVEEFNLLVDTLQNAGFDHYEISNFAKPAFESAHNSSYWKGLPYLGIGPSAHSFNGATRQYNIANNASYIRSLKQHLIPCEIEHLSLENKFNEKILTGLRTKWGVSLPALKEIVAHPGAQWEETLKKYITLGDIILEGQTVLLSAKGKRIADRVAGDLFV